MVLHNDGAHLFVLETKEKDFLEDGQSWRLPADSSLLILELHIPRIIGDFAAPRKGRASMYGTASVSHM